MNTTPNLRRRISALVAALISIAVFPALAAVPAISTAELSKQAGHIVTGTVVEITSKIGEDEGKGINLNRIYTIRLKVETVSKGADVKTGSEIEICAWQPITGAPGPQGHESIPQKGDKAKFYLQATGNKQFEPLLPNGIEPVGEKP